MSGNHVVTEPEQPEPEQPESYCGRCYMHNDPGGCVATLAAIQRAAALIEAAIVS